jgi:glutathione S-transferase
MIELYGFARVNAVARGNTRDLRVLWALEEMGLPFMIRGMDHPAHDLDTPEYKALNPLSQIPVLVDEGTVVTESGAILIYLARKSGKLMPKDLAGEAQVLRWSFAALNSLELPIMSIMFMDFSPEGNEKWRGFCVGWAGRHLGNLDRWLEHRTWIATDEFTVADILMGHVLMVNKDESLLAPHVNVRAYRERCRNRPAWERVIAAYSERVEAA